MQAYLEVWRPSGREVVHVAGDRVTIGKAPANDVVLDDARVSRLHAVIERYPAGWAVRDMGSRNGTHVNGERVIGERAVRGGDELVLGSTRLVFMLDARDDATATETAAPPPELTRRERDVLVALCRPVLSQAAFSEPASVKTIAAELVVTQATVKEYLGRLYDRFGLHDGDRRRVTLANEAIQRRAVTLTDLRA